MDHKNYGDNRWEFIFGEYKGLEKLAVDYLYGVVSAYTPYILTVSSCEKAQDQLTNTNPVFIGTVKSNPYIKMLSDKGIIRLGGKAEGYCIKVAKSIWNEEKQMMIVAGNDEAGVLYGAVDFENHYLTPNQFPQSPCSYERKLFCEEMPEYERISAPKISDRAIWTWGHVIYDYKRFIDNMVKLKLNMLVVWNDYVPVNAQDFVDYAHSRGIKVIWGYSWAWGVKVDISNPSELQKWADMALSVYENDYMSLTGDGVYFQSFTETDKATKNGIIIAEAVTEWVNIISAKLLNKYPDLYIQFGLHATSVKDKLEFIKNIDPRITIIWEDCGAFPYHYNPKNIDNYNETKALSSKIADLRENNERFGVVLKGLATLDWSIFEHQKGSFVLGKANSSYIKKRTEEKRYLWKYLQAYWLKNLPYAKEIIKEMAEIRNGRLIVQALVEDGMFEEKIWYPVALLTQMLWDYDDDLNDLMCHTALAKFVDMA